MAKFCLKKNSKRQPARLKYKVEKKVREHNRKIRKDNKKSKVKKPKLIQVPNICPFKEDILKEVERLKKEKEDERQKLREAAKLERKEKKAAGGTLKNLVDNAEIREKIHDTLKPDLGYKDYSKKEENSLKAYYKEFKKVVEAGDVILEVVDARDPQGTRCLQVEEAVANSMGTKRLVLVLNKADLIPRDILDKWLKYLRRTTPAVAFKASTQNQQQKLGQRKFAPKASKKEVSENVLKGSSCVGAELLMSLLANYCRNKGVKTSITVGVVGLPNVGKSSLINSLKRSKACNIGAMPGVTKSMQEVQLDSKIKLLDSPGIVFSSNSDASSSLRNVVRISSLTDPITPANCILQRVTKTQMMEMYQISEYNTPEEFYSLKAKRSGRFKKGGIPNVEAAARDLLSDWNQGKIKYYTVPPEENESSVHVSSTIVTEIAKEFDIEKFESMETEVLDKMCKEGIDSAIVVDSLGPTTLVDEMELDTVAQPGDKQLLSSNINIVENKKIKKGKGETRLKKVDPEMLLEGNQQLNKVKKMQFKKAKKKERRKEKIALQVASGLENFTDPTQKQESDSYDFNTDFNMIN
ncbi:hypothetical protein RN001_012651 [Aquatica leii]|uniref:Guanine nucleotide-binding protein-like 3 homolog n=1 Tax=Aquatica leii TaxID=1421715 RepID=A0AAN7PT38_9COLE|nr:hypothetical protein RN001_012651 [Aquatica leii]